jgi:hypothetical protein
MGFSSLLVVVVSFFALLTALVKKRDRLPTIGEGPIPSSVTAVRCALFSEGAIPRGPKTARLAEEV